MNSLYDPIMSHPSGFDSGSGRNWGRYIYRLSEICGNIARGGSPRVDDMVRGEMQQSRDSHECF